MSISMHVVGVVTNDKYAQMQEAEKACRRAGVPIPAEIRKYLDEYEYRED